ncbi:MAG: UDP-N-acetylglucosamine 2-epimerase (non-hydrolyzing) [Bacteroidetes bacterium]|nr:UDP-N-acetylglucosamine 2-epimerase (non-hydrolyzing) [Bacteroidota bacterium]
MIKIDLIVGARPNFMKIAPIIHAIHKANNLEKLIEYRLIHTGQHYDANMSETFFQELQIPKPHFNLNIGSGTQAEQTAGIMVGYEKLLILEKSNLCLVVGDVTSTMACAITARKMHIPVAHVEGGIRSGDETMPEEINRMVTDSITNYFFTTSEVANENLRKSGFKNESIFFVGNTMIDTLLKNQSRFVQPEIWELINLKEKNYIVLTLHRPANVDEESKLKDLINEIISHSHDLPLIFPVHPRTAKIISSLGISHQRLHMVKPMGYLEFNYLVERCKAVITDSGGITEEATVMGVPCMTLRANTERPETITIGTNELLGVNPEAIKPAMEMLFSEKWKKGSIPKMWDGMTGERIVKILCESLFTA